MSKLVSFAERELDLMLKSGTPYVIEDFIPEILGLVDKFGKSWWQSGGSAPYVAGALAGTIKKLCMFEPIMPIMGDSTEWTDVSEYGYGDGKKHLQNNRCHALFKTDDEDPRYGNAITFNGEKNGKFTGNIELKDGTRLSSQQTIKGFPFEPKTFYIDIIETEVTPGDWECELKDKSQLIKIFKYYKKE